MNLLQRLTSARPIEARQSFSITDLTMSTSGSESVQTDFEDFVRQAYYANGVVYACIAARMTLFSEARFKYRNRKDKTLDGRPIPVLDEPWPNGTTGDLLTRMEVHASVAGNAYVWRESPRMLRLLRPDWILVRVGDGRVVGYDYYEGGILAGNDPQRIPVDAMAHYAPMPDPMGSHIGMSWIRPVATEVLADKAMMRHKKKFFDNAATPNLAITYAGEVRQDVRKRLEELMRSRYAGSENAYKTLLLEGGADIQVVGANFEQMSFKTVQGHGETRIAAAAGVPPVIVGLSEGLQAATYSNYQLAMRRWVDVWARPSWRQAAGALATITPPIRGKELWYDDADVPALQQDALDHAEVLQRKASTYRTLRDAGVDHDSAAKTVGLPDLNSTGLLSVQLQPDTGVNPEVEGEG